MQTVNLHDLVELVPADNMTIDCDKPEIRPRENLALKAAHTLRNEAGVTDGVHINLHKTIPVSAGLGGGSSDAAATLMGLNRLWNLDVSIDDMANLAIKLGSDVPFFLQGGTAMVQGHGERVHPLPKIDLGWIVLVCPAIHIRCKTAALYSKLPSSSHTTGHLTRKLGARIRGAGEVPHQFLFNVFDSIAPDAYAGIEEYRATLHSLGAKEAHLAGSGPSLYTPVSKREQGTALQSILSRKYGWDTYLLSPWYPETLA